MVDHSASAQRAIEQFMVGTVDKETSLTNNEGTDGLNEENNHLLPVLDNHTVKQAEKRYIQIFKSFCSFVKGGWMATDDQLADILHSIANIRSRLPIELKASGLVDRNYSSDENWSSYGFQASLSVPNDVDLALSHDVIQHEKMMTSVRAMISCLSDCQGALGRKLDEIMKHNLQYGSFFMQENSPISCVEKINDLFSMLSMELHRKECLIFAVLNSNNDENFNTEENRSGGERAFYMTSGEFHMNAIKRCCVEWPRGSEHSFIDTVRLHSMIDSQEESIVTR